MRCHIPIEELRRLQAQDAAAAGRGGGRLMRIRAAVLERTGGALVVAGARARAARARARCWSACGASGICHSDQNAIDGVAEARCPAVLGHEGAGVVEAIGAGRAPRRRRRPRRALVGAVVRRVRRVPARAAAPVLDGVAGDGRRDAARRHLAAVARRRAGLPLLVHLVVRRRLRPAGALVRADPARRAVRRRRPRRLRDLDRHRRRLADGRGAARRPRRDHRLRRRRALGAARRGRRRRRRRSIAVDVSAAQARRSPRELGATDDVLWAGSPEATAEAVREASGGGVDYAIEATGRTEAMLAAFLSTRARGAAVLIGIPRADAMLPLPALSIPRMERRVLGSIYGSTYPERDFALTLDLYRRGRLPLDRLITHRVPLEQVAARDRPAARRRGDPRGRRPRRERGLMASRSDELDGRIGQGWGGPGGPNGSHVNVVLAAPRQRDRGGGARHVRASRRPATRRCMVCVGARPAVVRADLAADADDEQVDGARGPAPDAHLGRGAARHRPGRARRRRRRADRGDAAS